MDAEGPGGIRLPIFAPVGSTAPPFTVPVAIDCRYLRAGGDRLGYRRVEQRSAGRWVATREWSRHGLELAVADVWSQADGADRLTLERRLTVSGAGGQDASRPAEGVQLRLALRLGPPPATWRFFVPGAVYTPSQYAGEALCSFSDHRLAYPLVAAHEVTSGAAVSVARVSLARFDDRPQRPHRESRYLQHTDIGAVGFSTRPEAALLLYWPYHEGDRSAMLDALGTPASAFFEVGREPVDVTLVYEVAVTCPESFADLAFRSFERAWAIGRPTPPQVPFSLADAVDLRLASLAKTYREWDDGGAGFVLNFDPERGYASEAKAFGASFAVHRMTGSRDILEYGFTGRQLNAAYVLADRFGGRWLRRGARVVDFFVDHLASESGWMFTLYDLKRARPLYTCGDPDGPVMHYLGAAAEPGTYTRTMVEAATDLLLNYRLHRSHGSVRPDWLAACRRLAAFLVGRQNPDGTWYRAYTPNGAPIRSGAWFGGDERAATSATCVPIPFLLELADEDGPVGRPYRLAAEQAGRYVLAEHVAAGEYRGGTLDNPNVVDKEAALLTMKALLNLYEQAADAVWLEGARRAADLAVTWHFIWDVPLRPGTRLARAGVRSTGWGGINSIWGTGVTDIYSLFFAAELVRLSRLTGEPLYQQVADLAAHASVQLLSHHGDLLGFADVGMQPEGIAFCDQGVDDGLIAKGDIWGGLGWPYAAGTYGLSRYLRERSAG